MSTAHRDRDDMLGALAHRICFWLAPLARMLLGGVVLESALGSDDSLANWLALAWMGWTCFCVAVAVAGQRFPRPLLHIMFAIDIVILVATVLKFEHLEHAALACGITLAIFAASVRMTRIYTPVLLLAVPLTWFGKRVAIAAEAGWIPTQLAAPQWSEYVIALLYVIAATAVALYVQRFVMMEKFARDCTSVDMLLPDRSFEFDLQRWTRSLANLYSPDRAVAIFGGAVQNAKPKIFEHNVHGLEEHRIAESLIGGLENMNGTAMLIDCDAGIEIGIADNKPRPLDEHGLQLARTLQRMKIFSAMIFRMRIDRALGGVVCAVSRPIDDAIVGDLHFLSHHVHKTEHFLDQMAQSERGFIADARDVARRDLHDGVLQSLAALRMRLLTISKRNELAETPAQLELRKTVDLITLEQSRLRGFLDRSQHDRGLVNLIAELDVSLRGLSLQWEIDADLQTDAPAIPMDYESARNIEHLVREVLANAVRHASSNNLTVSLSLQQDALMIVVLDRKQEDLGETKEEGVSLPLNSSSLRHRLRIVNGQAYVEGLSRGQLLAITIPMQQVDDDA